MWPQNAGVVHDKFYCTVTKYCKKYEVQVHNWEENVVNSVQKQELM